MLKKMKNLLTYLAVLILGFGGGLLGANFALSSQRVEPSPSQNTKVSTVTTTSQNTTSTTEAVDKVKNAVVSVINYQKHADTSSSNFYRQIFGRNQAGQDQEEDLVVAAEGSGVIYKVDGEIAYLVTNTHVIEGADQIEILLSDGTKIIGDLVGSDTYSDIAVIKIDSDVVTTVAQFADSDKLTVGETAIAIGSPLGTQYANTVTQGIVSSLSRTVTLTNENGQTVSTNAIQTDAAINPGNSGGALINIQGHVIGINSSKVSRTSSAASVEGMSFAIPANDVIALIAQLEENGKVTRPALGISMVALNELSTNAWEELQIPEEVTSGIIVASIQKEMPADGALEKYDVITEIAGQEVSSASDLQSALYKHQIGDTIEITFYRGKDKKTVNIKLTKTSQELDNNP